jgi:NADH-quinone oxidoreductase subunit G
MSDTVKIIIDDKEYDVPAGENLVDMAKWYAGNDIPVFCYHPKLDPVGMCRMCLVEMGMIQKDRDTGEVLLDDDGKPQIRWWPTLQTACTQTVSDGLVIRTNTKRVADARRNTVEFLLTSHPLDCPTCDKGGECPLQNLTMAHGPGTSRMYFDDKQKLGKHLPLGDLIYLDQERCIQCARCIRFQDEVVGDDVLAFHERGRKLQIITHSEPGFNTYFSGNTTDICPVGALTTADFRFGARPWELREVPSICPHDAAGSNISLSMRLDRDFGGKAKIKRVMPRQNEYVNEIWISDKTRFGHHFTASPDRLQEPMVRSADGSLGETTWDNALEAVAKALKDAGDDLAAIAGSGMSNEDLWTLRQLVEGVGGKRLGAWPPTHAGADLVAQVGVGKGTNLSDLGQGDAVLVIASDLEEEVPVWRLRIKQAHDRGAYLVVANARHTRLADFADAVIEYNPGEAAQTMDSIEKDHAEIAETLSKAKNLIIVAGAEGLTLGGSRALMQAAANFLIKSKHIGKANNGLISPFPGPNGMGLYYMGFTPEATLDIAAKPPKVLIVAQAELMADDPGAGEWLDKVETIISLNLFPDTVSEKAAAALPIQSFAERDGSFTSGEHRVQRFYLAQGPMGEALPAWQILSRLGEKLGQGRAKLTAAAVMAEIAEAVPAFEGISYQALAKVEERQFPDVGGEDLYYGGTAYENKGGLGMQIATEADNGAKFRRTKVKLPEAPGAKRGEFLIIPSTRLYNRESTFRPSAVVHPRVLPPFIELNATDAAKMSLGEGSCVDVTMDEVTARVFVHVNGSVMKGTAVLPRNMGDVATPMTLTVGKISKVKDEPK